MIRFSRVEKSLKVELSSGLSPKENIFVLTWGCNDECYAELLSKHLNNKLQDALENIRRESYNQGFKDGKCKRKQQLWFARWF